MEKGLQLFIKYEPKDVFKGQLHMLGTFGLFSLDTLTVRKDALLKMKTLFKTNLQLHKDTEFLFRLSFYFDLYPGIIDQAVAIRLESSVWLHNTSILLFISPPSRATLH